MTFLADVNVLVALLDPNSLHHAEANEWFQQCQSWATCPITVSGCLRILSRPEYPVLEKGVHRLAALLRELCGLPGHQPWADDISILDEDIFDLAHIQGHRQLTDVYLLALAVKHKGQLVTFDRTIPWRAVQGAKASHLKLLGPKQ